jgi:hypothetical protein
MSLRTLLGTGGEIDVLTELSVEPRSTAHLRETIPVDDSLLCDVLRTGSGAGIWHLEDRTDAMTPGALCNLNPVRAKSV